ncbi:MAG: hypothetical protein E6301_04735 [Cronobacter sakazakii]|nr:hypothetical protein [Cronobacter sakazakii]
MTAAAPASNSGFVMLTNDLLNIEKIAGKVFTGNMKITYSLIQGFERNGQTAYFSQNTLKRQLGITTPTVVKLIRDMVAMGLINKTGQIGGKTCHYTVNRITPEMLGTAEPEAAAAPEAPQEQPQRATAEREELEESNHTAEPVEAPTVAEVKPMTAAPGPTAPITLVDVYSKKVETVDQPEEAAGIVPAFAYPRGEMKEVSDYDFGDPF